MRISANIKLLTETKQKNKNKYAMVKNGRNFRPNLQKIVFIWIVPHQSFIEPFTDVFDTKHNFVKINIEFKIFGYHLSS